MDRIKVIAAGVDTYDHLPNVQGAIKDAESIVTCLTDEPNISLFGPSQLTPSTPLTNPTSSKIRESLTEYASSVTALHDVLFFYFAGHAVPLGSQDLGLCTIDTKYNQAFEAPISSSLIRFSDVIEIVSKLSVYPIFFLDVCHAGLGSSTIINEFQGLKKSIESEKASSYALLAACTSDQESICESEGGIFTQSFCNIAKHGIESLKSPFVRLEDMITPLREHFEKVGCDMQPQFLIGSSMPEIKIFRNAKFSMQTEKMNGYFVPYLSALWNNGNPKEISTSDLRDMGSGIYGNHSKLTYAPWFLVEKGPTNKFRRLTEKGIKFLADKISVNEKIYKDFETNEWKNDTESKLIFFSDLLEAHSKPIKNRDHPTLF